MGYYNGNKRGMRRNQGKRALMKTLGKIKKDYEQYHKAPPVKDINPRNTETLKSVDADTLIEASTRDVSCRYKFTCNLDTCNGCRLK